MAIKINSAFIRLDGKLVIFQAEVVLLIPQIMRPRPIMFWPRLILFRYFIEERHISTSKRAKQTPSQDDQTRLQNVSIVKPDQRLEPGFGECFLTLFNFVR